MKNTNDCGRPEGVYNIKDITASQRDQKGIDREAESRMVMRYQRTEDLAIMEKLFIDRVPTLWWWANNYHYLRDSSEDLFSELTSVFMNAVKKYKSRRQCRFRNKQVSRHTLFNTYLFTSLNNHIKNELKKKRAAKRKPYGADPNSISNNFILSLDFNYSRRDGSSTTLKDLIANSHQADSLEKKVFFTEAMNLLNKQYPGMTDFFEKLGGGCTITSALRDYKTKEGKIKLSPYLSKKLSHHRRYNMMVANLIRRRKHIDKAFKLVDYKAEDKHLHYKIELRKTPETDIILKNIRKIRKKKDAFVSLIRPN